MMGKTIEQLVVGQRAEATRPVTADLVRAFVALSGDSNPLHRDADFAASTAFGEPIAPGILTAALAAAVIGSELPGPGAVYLSQTLKFLRPVRIDDRITARVEVAEVLQDRNRVCLRTLCVNQSGDPVMVGEAWVMPPKTAQHRESRAERPMELARAA